MQNATDNFPRANTHGFHPRDLNWGEFVHFWSGAAGVNLKTLATSAFGWPTEWENQFVQAQRSFPFTYANPGPSVVTLFQDMNYGGYNFTGATLTKTADDASLVDDGWNDRATSLVVSAN